MNLSRIIERIAISLEVFSSEEKYKGEHLSVFERNGYEYVHRNSGNQFTAILPFAKEDDAFYIYVHMEPRLTHNETHVLIPSCVTGSVEEGETAFENAVKELAEEVGFYASQNRWAFLGEFWPSKATDEVCFAFAVDVTGLRQGESKGDGSTMEKLSSPLKMKWEDAIKSVPDTIFHTMLSKVVFNNVTNDNVTDVDTSKAANDY